MQNAISYTRIGREGNQDEAFYFSLFSGSALAALAG
jgi:hypothetical protein